MNLTAEEKIMYNVMMAIYDSGIPMSFKGSLVLKACLLEAGYSDDTRHTVDIDGNWVSDTPPTGEEMTQSLQKALRESGIELDVSIYRMYGESRSAGFELADSNTGEILFSMDVDVNRPAAWIRIYEIEGIRFPGVSPSQMIADKLSAVSTDKVFRRIKDVVDLYYLSKVFDLDKTEILNVLNELGRTLENFDGFLHRADELRHSYEKFRFAGDIHKPPFDEVYRQVKKYIGDFLPKERFRDNVSESSAWEGIIMNRQTNTTAPFYLFGMGNRRKLLWRQGRLVSVPDGAVLYETKVLRETIDAAAYAVLLETKDGTVTIREDENAVTLTEADGRETVLAQSFLHLPDFSPHPYRDALRILHHEILVNIADGKPVPNFFVYKKPWYRDAAMMAMVLEKTGNLSLIADWAASLTELYDRNNAGIEESDNLGQLLYLLAVTGNRDHPLIGQAVAEAKRRSVNGSLTGLSDFAEHPVYQTRWLKLGLEALGLDSGWVRIPDVPDSYASLFWMDKAADSCEAGGGTGEGGEEAAFDENYPYLSWAGAHSAGFSMDEAHLNALLPPTYPLSHETNASQAAYSELSPYLPELAQAHCAAPHTWHAAEMFLYLADRFGLPEDESGSTAQEKSEEPENF